MITGPTILADKSRLQEIYDLRVTAYEHSAKSVYVNWKTFPNGLLDDLDELDTTIHWIIEDNNKIVASARLAILENIVDTHEDFDRFELPAAKPFAYWSRLVVHPDYRRTMAMLMLDNARKKYLRENTEIKFAICCATEERTKAIIRMGFKYLGDIIYNWGGRSSQLIFILQLNITDKP